MKQEKTHLTLLRLAACCVFAGRAWQHLFWDAPYRELFWDQDIMEPFIKTFTSMSWDDYAANPAVDGAIAGFIIFLGAFYLLCMFCSMVVKRRNSAAAAIVLTGAASLALLALLYTKESFFHAGQFLEYALQFGSPCFLVLALGKEGEASRRLFLLEKVAIALTFSCHGLYALGFYPVPGSFMTMTMNILGTGDQGTQLFLKTAGILDLVVAAGCFLPFRWSRWMLLYVALWGLATAMARIWGNFYLQFPLESLHQWLHEVVYRLPHALVPLALMAGMAPAGDQPFKWPAFLQGGAGRG